MWTAISFIVGGTLFLTFVASKEYLNDNTWGKLLLWAVVLNSLGILIFGVV